MLLSAAVVSLVFAASAQAAIYKGRANNGTRVEIRTKSNGVPKKVEFGKYRTPCNRRFTHLRHWIIGFIPPFDIATVDHLLDRGKLHGHQRIRGVGRVRFRASWHFEAEHTWMGRYRTQKLFKRRGRIVTRCRTGFSFDLPLRD